MPKSSLHFFRGIPENWDTSFRECNVDLKDAVYDSSNRFISL